MSSFPRHLQPLAFGAQENDNARHELELFLAWWKPWNDLSTNGFRSGAVNPPVLPVAPDYRRHSGLQTVSPDILSGQHRFLCRGPGGQFFAAAGVGCGNWRLERLCLFRRVFGTLPCEIAALGMPERANSLVRFSLGRESTLAEVETVGSVLPEVVRRAQLG